MVTRSLIVVTRNRLHFLRPRIPYWREALRRGDINEVVVGDSSRPEIAREVHSMCTDVSFRYVYNRCSQFRDSRVSSFNLGAKVAHGEWIMFSSDKMDLAGPMDQDEFNRVAAGCDFMKAPESHTTRIFSRRFFFEIGGYDRRFINGEDVKITEVAKSRGGLGDCSRVWPSGRVLELEDLNDPIDVRARSWNHFRYGLSALSLALLVRDSREWSGRVLLIELSEAIELGYGGGLGPVYSMCRMLGWLGAIPFYVGAQHYYGEPVPVKV